MSRNWVLADIVNLERYPIDALESSAGQALIADCRASFADAVCCELKAFIRPNAVAAVIADVEAREDRAFRSARKRSAYAFYAPSHGELLEEKQGEPDPHATPQWRDVTYLGYDCFGTGSVLHRLYEAPEVVKFVAAVLDLPAVHTVADPLMAAPISLHYEGSQLGWHCDTQEFTITVMFRPSQSGGVFEYLPQAGPGQANFSSVPAVFAGSREGLRSVAMEVGSIMLFRGANTLHRVTPTEGTKPRILSVFHLEQTPGWVYPEQWKIDVFGRPH